MRQWLAHHFPAAGVRAVAAPYVAGDSLEAAIAAADDLWRERQIASTLDALGEHVDSADRAAQALELYFRTVEQVRDRPWISLSAKPGHLGYHVSPELGGRQVAELAATCQDAGVRLTLDMEDRDLTTATLELYRDLRPRYDVLGMVLQTKLYRTPEDLDSLAGLGARVRLCLGIYDVPGAEGTQNKRVAKANLLGLLPRAFDLLDTVEIATHDEQVITRARRLIDERGIDPSRVEFQMLLGVPRRRVQDELRREGYAVRLYLPFAEHWDDAVAYLRRRLSETPSLALLVLRNLILR